MKQIVQLLLEVSLKHQSYFHIEIPHNESSANVPSVTTVPLDDIQYYFEVRESKAKL